MIQPVVDYSACISTLKDDYNVKEVSAILSVDVLKRVTSSAELETVIETGEAFTKNLSAKSIDAIRADCKSFTE